LCCNGFNGSRPRAGLRRERQEQVQASHNHRLTIDCEAFMQHRSPLQHLLHNLLPSKGSPERAPGATDFVDTQPVDASAAAVQAARRTLKLPPTSAAWAESALDLELGTDIMEYPDDTAADLMDEFFASSEKKAA
jgi:hypothetical protein